MATIKEIKELYNQAKYREIIEAVDTEALRIDFKEDEEKRLQVAWSHHQLGEYDKSIPIMEVLSGRHSSDTEIGESARRGLAHGLLQWKRDIEAADKIMQEIPPSLNRDNVRMNIFIKAARKGLVIPVREVIATITNAIQTVPYISVNGHIINNGALVLHEARKQDGARPYLPILPGLIDIAIGIYEATGTAKNHLAAAEFRASQICEAAGWDGIAKLSAEESVKLWQELVDSQDGARYKQNLDGALTQLKKLQENKRQ